MTGWKWLTLLLMLGAISPRSCFASDPLPQPSMLTNTIESIRYNLIDQTRMTVFQNGGPATFMDFSVGRSNAFRIGAIDHVLTNRFLTADIGYSGGTDGHVDGIAVFGPGIQVNSAFTSAFPVTSLLLTHWLPERFQHFFFGANLGWGTDNWAPHYGVHFGYDFGK